MVEQFLLKSQILNKPVSKNIKIKLIRRSQKPGVKASYEVCAYGKPLMYMRIIYDYRQIKGGFMRKVIQDRN